jgi:hypothetical protein
MKDSYITAIQSPSVPANVFKSRKWSLYHTPDLDFLLDYLSNHLHLLSHVENSDVVDDLE